MLHAMMMPHSARRDAREPGEVSVTPYLTLVQICSATSHLQAAVSQSAAGYCTDFKLVIRHLPTIADEEPALHMMGWFTLFNQLQRGSKFELQMLTFAPLHSLLHDCSAPDAICYGQNCLSSLPVRSLHRATGKRQP